MPGTLVSNLEMNNRILIGPLVAGACAALFVTLLAAADLPREHLSLNAGWKFHLGGALCFVDDDSTTMPRLRHSMSPAY